jgi:hypothetical protein
MERSPAESIGAADNLQDFGASYWQLSDEPHYTCCDVNGSGAT